MHVFGKKKPQSLSLKGEVDLLSLTSSLEQTKINIAEVRTLGQAAVERIESLEQELNAEGENHVKTSQRISDLKNEIAAAERELSAIKKKQITIQDATQTAIGDKNEIGIEFVRLQNSYKTESEAYGSSMQTIEKKLQAYASGVGADRSHASFGTPVNISKAIVIGDLHGWAPGLIHAINRNNIGQVEILNRPVVDSRLPILFPNPVQLHGLGLPLPCVGLNRHPLRPNARPTMFDGIHVNMESNDGETTLIQVGDVIDRGDHSELSLELLRSMLIQQPCSNLTLLGNHEVWVIEGDVDGWMRNEERYRMTDGKPGSVIHDPLITGLPDLSSSLKNSFAVLEGAIGAFLLTQHFSFRLGLGPSQRKEFDALYNDALTCLKIRKLEHKVLKGGWALHQIGKQALEVWRSVARQQPIHVPGGFAMVTIAGTTFGHAEPSAFQHPQVDLQPLDSIWNWGGQNMRFIPAVLDRNGLRNAPLFYSRTNEKEEGKWHDEVRLSFLELLQHSPDTIRYCHGHTVIKAPDVRNVDLDGNQIEVVNCDLGMTPFYRHLRHGDAYQVSTLPYLVHLEFEAPISHGEE